MDIPGLVQLCCEGRTRQYNPLLSPGPVVMVQPGGYDDVPWLSSMEITRLTFHCQSSLSAGQVQGGTVIELSDASQVVCSGDYYRLNSEEIYKGKFIILHQSVTVIYSQWARYQTSQSHSHYQIVLIQEEGIHSDIDFQLETRVVSFLSYIVSF